MFTIIYTAEDNGQQFAYGTFSTRLAAEQRRKKMERELDPRRDLAGGGVGSLQVVKIQTLKDWGLADA